MKIIVENRVRLKDPPNVLQEFLIQGLRIPNPKYLEAISAGRSVYGISPFIMNFSMLPDESILIPKGMLQLVISKCKEMGILYDIEDKRKIFDHIDINSGNIKFRDYQIDAVTSLTSNSSGILIAPAGSGKTVMGLSLIPIVGQPTLWLTHTGPLAAQAKERAEKFLPDIGKIGLIGKGEWEKGDVLTIGMIQTLVRNIEDLYKIRNDFGMIIVDEAHHVPSRTFMDVIGQFNAYYTYGLTATPKRRDNLEALMFQTIGMSTTTIPIKKVSEYGGIIVPEVLCKVLRSEKVEGNDIQKIIKNHIIGNSKRNSVIVSDILREAKAGHFCIVISDRREHCEMLYESLSSVWPKTGIATGKYSKKYVSEQVKAYNENRITILVATSSLLGEGFDVPFLDRAFLTMPFRSETKTEQIIGRIQRTHEGKKDAVVFDYVDIDIGVVENQFSSKYKDSRLSTYNRLGVKVRYE